MDLLGLDAAARQYHVEQLLARYVQCIDADRLEDWPTFFTERCRYVVQARENAARDLPLAAIYCDSRGMLVDRVVALRHANIYERHHYRHLFAATVIEDVSADALTAHSNYVVFRTRSNGVSEVFSAGVYRDRIVVEDGTLRFAEKIVTFDTDRIDTLLVIPL